MKDDRIIDYISGKEIRATPEEVEAVQVFARQLVEDYGYDKGQIRTRPQWRVKARPSDSPKSYPVDIAVFAGEPHTDDNLRIVVECKKKTRRDGLGQLKDYLRFSTALAGAWFNGKERIYLAKREERGRVDFEEIPNLPRKGERLEDIGKFCRKDLTVSHNLKIIFSAARNYLAANAIGVTRDEQLAQQLINLVFCKIYDERFTPPNNMLEFRAGVSESPGEIAQRIRALFEKVKAKYSEVISFNDKIDLDEKSIVYIVGEMQNFCLIEAERDAVADAFEMFIGDALKGGQGQFFTPRNVVRLMVSLADPDSDKLIVDPACGSGGFLVESLRHIWTKIEQQGKLLDWSESAISEEKTAVAMKRICGLEKDAFLNKVAKAYMAILGDGKGGIHCEDSLELPESWGNATRQHIGLGRFDFVLTNPPFGRDVKVIGEEKLAQYQVAHRFQKADDGDSYVVTDSLKTEIRSEIVFIERSLQLLRDGGILGIILPETFFHAPQSAPILWFMRQHNLKWFVDLPHNTFRPHNNAKCVIVILQKNTPQQEKIGMAVAEEMGHDHKGRILYRWDYRKNQIDKNSIWDDIKPIMEELGGDKKKRRYTFEMKAKVAEASRIYVPRYYWREREREILKIAKDKNFHLVEINALIDSGIIRPFEGDGSPRADYKGKGEIPYVRVKDIVNWEIYKDPTATVPEEIYLKMKGEDLQVGDIFYVRRGSYRIGSVAMVSPYDLEILRTKEILGLRIEQEENEYGLNPHYLLYLLSHRLVQMQSFNRVLIETTLPNIADRWRDLKLPFFASKTEGKKISRRIREVIESKWKAIAEIRRIKKEHGELTT